MSSRRAARLAGCVLGTAAVLVAAGVGSGTPAAAVTPETETGGVCGTTLTRYGHRLHCLKGSFYDRVQVGSIDYTFAIRSDRAVVYAGRYFDWRRVGTGHADDVEYVDDPGGAGRRRIVTSHYDD